MKKLKKLAVVLTAISLSLVSAGCDLSLSESGGGLARRVKNFTVVAEDVAEIGQYYTPEIPDATLDGKKAVVSVSATQNGKALTFNAANALLVEAFGDITITYIIAENGEKIEKSTLLKVQDTTAPYIVINSMPEAVYRGEVLNFADYIRIGDLSGIVSESEITVTDQMGEAITVENGAFTLPEDSTATELTLSVTATDGKNNVAQEQVKLSVFDYVQWNKPFDFKALDMSKVTTHNTGAFAEKAEMDGASVIKISRKGEWLGKTGYTAARIELKENLANYTNFDYIKLTVSAQTNCDIQIKGAATGNNFKSGSVATDKATLVYDMSKVKEGNASVIKDGKLVIEIAALMGRTYDPMPTSVDVNFYIYDIEFGYYEREVVNDKPIDVTAFGMQADEVISATFTPEESNVAETVNLSSWMPKKGLLTITLKKDGYRKTTVEIPVLPVAALVGDSSEAENDNDVSFPW